MSTISAGLVQTTNLTVNGIGAGAVQASNLDFNNLDVSGNLTVRGSKVMNQNMLNKELFNKVKESFLHVVTGDLAYGGSASFVDLSGYTQFSSSYDYILTAAHLIYYFDDSDNRFLYDNVYFHTISPENTVLNVELSSDLVVYSYSADVAILRVPAAEGRSKLKLATTVENSEVLCCMGWTDLWNPQNTVYATVKQPEWSPGDTRVRTPVCSVLVDTVTMMGGNSGGPWINQNGEISAICSWGYTIETIEDVDFVNSYDIFGVNCKSIRKLIEKYTGSEIPYRYMGKKTYSGFYGIDIFSLLNYYPSGILEGGVRGHGFYPVEQELIDLGVSDDDILTEIDGKKLGILDGQSRVDIPIYYCDSSSINVKVILGAAGGNTTETNFQLPVVDRTEEEDDMFVYLTQPVIKKMKEKFKKNIEMKLTRKPRT